ncbi:hypothetical protein [Echinicola vietnamensis]|nr:hypothetical protein [Echinicola vietnamensis]
MGIFLGYRRWAGDLIAKRQAYPVGIGPWITAAQELVGARVVHE